MKHRRRSILYLALLLIASLLLWALAHRAPQAPLTVADALAPYEGYLYAHGISPDDVLDYSLSTNDEKSTLQLTLPGRNGKKRLISISTRTEIR